MDHEEKMRNVLQRLEVVKKQKSSKDSFYCQVLELCRVLYFYTVHNHWIATGLDIEVSRLREKNA
jgi:hypothetical protein